MGSSRMRYGTPQTFMPTTDVDWWTIQGTVHQPTITMHYKLLPSRCQSHLPLCHIIFVWNWFDAHVGEGLFWEGFSWDSWRPVLPVRNVGEITQAFPDFLLFPVVVFWREPLSHFVRKQRMRMCKHRCRALEAKHFSRSLQSLSSDPTIKSIDSSEPNCE